MLNSQGYGRTPLATSEVPESPLRDCTVYSCIDWRSEKVWLTHNTDNFTARDANASKKCWTFEYSGEFFDAREKRNWRLESNKSCLTAFLIAPFVPNSIVSAFLKFATCLQCNAGPAYQHGGDSSSPSLLEHSSPPVTHKINISVMKHYLPATKSKNQE